MIELKLNKPLAFFDLETTGTNISKDRIVEIAIIKVMPDNSVIEKHTKVNPTIPIPIETSLIHGIYDKDVADAPTFKDISHDYNQFLAGCDLAGFNHIKFDIPVLMEEFNRVNINFDISSRKLVDAQKIFHLMEPRTLSAAYKFYCQQDLTDAHSALADTRATLEVLKAQIEKYENVAIKNNKGKVVTPIANNMEQLHEFSVDRMVDLAGRMIFNEKREELFNFGKYKGQKVEDVFKKDPSYYDWMMNGDFPVDTKNIITKIKVKNLFNK